jgi:hypothetical protein
MAIKIENNSTLKLPGYTEKHIQALLDSVPKEHLRGIDRVKLVDHISDPQLRNMAQANKLPGLYRPKQGIQPASLEVATEILLPQAGPFYKKIAPRMSYKANLAAVLFSLVAQHYHLTLKHSVKRTQLEQAVRTYTEKQLRKWQDGQKTLRAKIFNSLQPMLERWGKKLQKRAAQEKKRERKSAA